MVKPEYEAIIKDIEDLPHCQEFGIRICNLSQGMCEIQVPVSSIMNHSGEIDARTYFLIIDAAATAACSTLWPSEMCDPLSSDVTIISPKGITMLTIVAKAESNGEIIYTGVTVRDAKGDLIASANIRYHSNI